MKAPIMLMRVETTSVTQHSPTGLWLRKSNPTALKAPAKIRKTRIRSTMSDPNNWKEQLYRNSLHFIWDIKQNLFTLLFMKHIQSLKNGERNMGNANRKERLFNKTRNDKYEISISYSGFSETGISKPPYVHSVFIYSAIFMLLECFWRRCWYYCTLIRQRVLLQTSPSTTQIVTNWNKEKIKSCTHPQ